MTTNNMSSDADQPKPSHVEFHDTRPIPLRVLFLLFRIRQIQEHLMYRVTHLNAEIQERRPFRGGPAKGDIKEAQGMLKELDRFSYILLRGLSHDNRDEWVMSFAERGQEVLKATPRVKKPELVGTCRF